MLKTMYQKLLLVVGSVMFALPVYAQHVISFTIAPTQVVGGSGATATITLDVPAPTGGISVSLYSYNPAVANTLHSSVTVPQGSTTTTFPITTYIVTTPQSVNFWCHYDFDIQPGTTTSMFVVPAGFTGTAIGMVIDPLTITSGTIGHGIVYLGKPAPAVGASVKLKSSNTRVKVPTSVLVPAGAMSMPFDITTKPYCQDDVALITATYKTVSTSVWTSLSTIHLSQPTGLTATPDSDSVVLKWNRDPYAHSYRIEATIDGISLPKDEIVTCAQTNLIVRYDDIDAVRGEPIEYKVVAVNEYGDSPSSAGVTVTPPLRAPVAPRLINGVGGDHATSLVWSGVPDAANYKVYRRLTTQTGWHFLSLAQKTKFVDSTALNGVTYAYSVAGVNATKEGKKSGVVLVTPMPSTQTSETITTRARTFLSDIGQPVTITNADTGETIEMVANTTFPAEPTLLSLQNHYANRWKVVFPHAEMEILDATGEVVYFRRLVPTVSGTALSQEMAQTRADVVQLAAGLTSSYSSWQASVGKHFVDNSIFWKLWRRHLTFGLPVRDQYLNMELAMDGTVLSFVMMEPYAGPATMPTVISQDDAKQLAQTVLDLNAVSGTSINSSGLAIVRSNNKYADPVVASSDPAVRVAWIIFFARSHGGSSELLGDDIFEVWIDAETGALLGGEMMPSLDGKTSAQTVKKQTSRSSDSENVQLQKNVTVKSVSKKKISIKSVSHRLIRKK
jgi:hypothetical protein